LTEKQLKLAICSCVVFNIFLAQDSSLFPSPHNKPDPIKWFFATSQQLDPKWEFPRSRLILGQELGKGEFCRVLRARALDIGGVIGE
jgi:hypothetical protein